MTEKMDYYELFGSLVPGVLLLCWIFVCFPEAWNGSPAVHLPEAFTAIAFVAVAIFLGQILQALGSLLEPALFRSWGGKPSDRALDPDTALDGYLPKDSCKRIRRKLFSAVGEGATTESLFLAAIQKAEGVAPGRAARFNSLYAYHRALLVLMVSGLALLLTSYGWGAAGRWAWQVQLWVPGLLLALSTLLWHRTRQRACYYAREVLLTAERAIEDGPHTSGDKSGRHQA